ncbi:MAG: hypothetical protein Q7T08_03495 [Devosia sp.]|nr:hypothetical protein [Devosia sp.]
MFGAFSTWRSVSQFLKPVVSRIRPVTTGEVKHSQQSERRICDTLEPIVNQYRR